MIFTPETLQITSPNGFIVFDGVNGAGKSTMLQRSSDLLTKRQLAHLRTREPGGTELGKALRELLLRPTEEKASPLAEALLFAADRADHVHKVIKPAIENETIVLCDRYYYSTLAFQGYGRELDLDEILTLNTIAIQNTRPDVVIVLDLDPETGLRRNQAEDAAAATKDGFEKEALEFHRRLRYGFLKIAETLSEPFVIIDADRTTEQVWSDVQKIVLKVVGEGGA